MEQQRMMSKAADMMSSEMDAFAVMQLSALAADPYKTMKHGDAVTQADDSTSRTSASSFVSTVSSTSQLSGWGSAISRKSYACLRTLEEETRRFPHQQQAVAQKLVRRNLQQTPYNGETWGYFVDTPDC